MRRREKESFEKTFERIPSSSLGEALYFRPFEADARKIAEIAKFVGEKKSDVARKLVHTALAGKEIKLGDNRLGEKIDWLIRSARNSEAIVGELLNRRELNDDRFENIETRLQRQNLLGAEMYCMLNVAVSSLNQTFGKMLEFLSPVELERTHSVHVATQIMTALIEHAVEDLKRCRVHYGIIEGESSDLYISSKIESLKRRLGGP